MKCLLRHIPFVLSQIDDHWHLLSSTENRMDNLPMHIGELKIAPRVPICQLLVIKTQKMKHPHMQIVNVYLILHRSKPEVVRA